MKNSERQTQREERLDIEKSEKLADFNYDVFKSCLIHADEHPLHIEQLPTKIETGKIGQALNDFYDQSDEDPERRERGGMVVQTPENKLLVTNIPVVGEKYSVGLNDIQRNRP